MFIMKKWNIMSEGEIISCCFRAPGHVAEKLGSMMYLSDMIKEKHPEFNIKYGKGGKVYFYTDD